MCIRGSAAYNNDVVTHLYHTTKTAPVIHKRHAVASRERLCHEFMHTVVALYALVLRCFLYALVLRCWRCSQ